MKKNTYRKSKIGQNKGDYKFHVEKQKDGGAIVKIPGHGGGGPDGPTEPDYPEQEAWMQQTGLEGVWYLVWKCKDEKELNDFLEQLKTLE